MRLFAALEVPEGIRGKVHALGDSLPRGRVRMVREENIHITLKFLGEVKEGEAVGWVLGQLGKVEFSPFPVFVRGVGAFPNAKNARILWAGAEGEGGEGELEGLAEKIGDALSGRFAKEGKFSAHITFARAKGGMDARKFLEEHSGEEFGEFGVGEFVLMQSVLGGGGAKYQVVREFGAKEEG